VDEPSISYEQLVERALRGVLREALIMTRDSGLPGQHHFYITFRTGHSGVQMPPRLKAMHPDEMTIVLQHQFWELTVEPEWFSIELSFSGKREYLKVPFEAVTAFADPYAKFGLQFQIELDGDFDEFLDEDDLEIDGILDENGVGDAAGKKPAADAKTAEGGDSKVVTLDAFRKK